VFFAELGQDAHIEGGLLYDAINHGVSLGYESNYLRKSVSLHPWLRQNSGDNTPAIVHVFLNEGDRLKITFMPKGGGAENYSALAMLNPAQGIEGIKAFVLETVKKAGPNACPPYVLGIGIGGNFETAPLLAKKALCRTLNQPHESKETARLEAVLLAEINALGIGAQGLGGRVTALSAAVEIFPCHIASLPVAVNINCHVSRHESITL
jgi:fumarate hydratase subunit alpha